MAKQKKSVLSQPHLHDEEAAFRFLENIIWPDGPVCPHCGCMSRIGRIKANPDKRVRHGLLKCHDCGKQFRATVGTVFEHARLPLHKMLQAAHLLCASKKGISSHQLARVLDIQLKSAWFLSHRLRLAMADGTLPPLGSGGKIVEIDETAYGRLQDAPKAYLHAGASRRKPSGPNYTNTVLTLVERGGSSRTFHVDGRASADLLPVIRAHVSPDARVMTDEWGGYFDLSKHFASHESVKHSKDEYVRGDVHTNTVEGYFSVFKRGMKGVYQHCAEKHLHRYLAEFNFRYSNRSAVGIEDGERADRALKGIVGKRLTYRRTDEVAVPF
jgi:transposase-like protein